MAPPTYPSRGAWRFTNVSRAVDFWPTLDSVAISTEHPDMVSAFTCRVVDAAAALAFQVEDEVIVAFRGERLWAGHLKTVGQDQLSEVGPRVWDLAGQDYTAKLDDAIVRRRRKRKKESAKRRVRWLLRSVERRVWTLAGIDLSNVPDETVEAYDYYGATVADGLGHVADELRLHAWIDVDNVFRMARTESVTAPFGLDDESPDYVTTFPFREWRYDQDSVDLANAVLVEPEERKDSRWVKDAASVTAYGRQERFLSDGNLHGSTQARRVGERTLEQAKDPELEGHLVVHEPGLAAGMTVHVRQALWGEDADRFIRAVEIAALDPHDEAGEAYLVSTLTLTSGRRRRLRGRGGRGRDGSLDRVTRRRPGQTADVDPHVVDDFSRVVAPPSWEAGDAIGATATKYGIYTRYRRYGADAVWPRTGVLHEEGPTTVGPYAVPSISAIAGAWSFIGADATPWTQQGADFGGCEGLSFWLAGWEDREVWHRFTVPEHPAGMAGFTGTLWQSISAGARDGVASRYGLDVVAMPTAPTTTWQGTVIGHIPNGGNATFFVPADLVASEGSDMWIGLRAAWKCHYGAEWCGWDWPRFNGVEDSGQYFSPPHIVGLRWATWVDAGTGIGSMAVVAAAPWEGGNAWRDAGVEGPAVSGVDGSALYVEGTGGKGWYLVGEREDEAEPWGPWSDCSWGAVIVFEKDSTVATGTSTIEVRTTGEGEATTGTVHLGDGSRAAGVSVASPTTTVYIAKAIADDTRYAARFDSRSGKMRGKVWAVADREPALWDVEVPMSETEDDADRLTLWLRAGAGQTVKVHRLQAQDDARDGTRVVREWLGYTDGLHNRFQTDHPFRAGTLRVHVNGVGVAPEWEDGPGAAFALDLMPTAHSVLRATYIVDMGG